jgi:hypothetical protein
MPSKSKEKEGTRVAFTSVESKDKGGAKHKSRGGYRVVDTCLARCFDYPSNFNLLAGTGRIHAAQLLLYSMDATLG